MSSSAERLTVGRPKLGVFGTIKDAYTSIRWRRRLIWYLTLSSLRRRGTDSTIGNLWWILDPTLQIAIYYVLVGVILKRSMPAFPLFLFAAILPWRWFTSTLGDATTAIRRRDKTMRQIAFPHIVIPTATIAAGVGTFFFGLVPLMGLYLFYPDRLTIWVLATPLVVIVQIAWTIPIVLMLSALSVFFRDLENLTSHVTRLWFYVSPGLYGADQLRKLAAGHPPINIIVDLNPFTWLFDAYRSLIYYGRPADWGALLGLFVASIPCTFAALYLFRRMSSSFVKVL
jgi:ABC-type polysaccharide/polyol phosphate export permease